MLSFGKFRHQAAYEDVSESESESELFMPTHKIEKSWSYWIRPSRWNRLTELTEHLRPCWTRLKTSIRSKWWAVDCAMLSIIALLGVQLIRDRVSHRIGVAEDIIDFVPEFSHHVITFEPDIRYVLDRSPNANPNIVRHMWEDLLPLGEGMIQVPGYEKYDDLPNPIPLEPEGPAFALSVHHQLHCLHSIMSAYDAYVHNRTNTGLKWVESQDWHVDHCFDYLRQSIMCCGDTALEGGATVFPKQVVGTDGWNVKHMCKNYDEINAYAVEHRASDDKDI